MTLPLTQFLYRHLILNKSGVEDEAIFDGTEAVPTSDVAVEEKDHHEGHHDYDPEEIVLKEQEEWRRKDFSFFVQFVFVFIAFGNATRLGMEALRYRTVSTYYENGYLGDKDNTNWWKLGNDIFLNGGFGIWALAFCTQLLSLFGIA